MNRHLHILCSDVPCPADCGYSIDVFNRIKAFHQKGIRIHLHYFDDTNNISKELNDCCETITTYSNKKTAKAYTNNDLINNLNDDNSPILFEGLSLAGILNHVNTTNRKICIRLHKKENFCHNHLSKNPSGHLKTVFGKINNLINNKKQHNLPRNCMYACFTQADAIHLQDMGISEAFFIPAFPAWHKIESVTGAGNFCLFHGNLSVPENEKAVLWLLDNVFNKIRVPFVIAGKNPSNRLQKAAHLYRHTCLVSSPGEQELNDLIRKAHINILPCVSKNYTGIHFKLLHALYEGRHCVVTPSVVNGTAGLEGACHVGSTANSIASILSQLYYQPFQDEEIKLRENLLYKTYNNEKNIEKFIDYLW